MLEIYPNHSFQLGGPVQKQISPTQCLKLDGALEKVIIQHLICRKDTSLLIVAEQIMCDFHLGGLFTLPSGLFANESYQLFLDGDRDNIALYLLLSYHKKVLQAHFLPCFQNIVSCFQCLRCCCLLCLWHTIFFLGQSNWCFVAKGTPPQLRWWLLWFSIFLELSLRQLCTSAVIMRFVQLACRTMLVGNLAKPFLFNYYFSFPELPPFPLFSKLSREICFIISLIAVQEVVGIMMKWCTTAVTKRTSVKTKKLEKQNLYFEKSPSFT